MWHNGGQAFREKLRSCLLVLIRYVWHSGLWRCSRTCGVYNRPFRVRRVACVDQASNKEVDLYNCRNLPQPDSVSRCTIKVRFSVSLHHVPSASYGIWCSVFLFSTVNAALQHASSHVVTCLPIHLHTWCVAWLLRIGIFFQPWRIFCSIFKSLANFDFLAMVAGERTSFLFVKAPFFGGLVSPQKVIPYSRARAQTWHSRVQAWHKSVFKYIVFEKKRRRQDHPKHR